MESDDKSCFGDIAVTGMYIYLMDYIFCCQIFCYCMVTNWSAALRLKYSKIRAKQVP